jgi:hypothetical protein
MRNRPTLLVLYGPPAVGKLTVARAIADARPSFRVLHNHVTLDAVSTVLEFGSPGYFQLVSSWREQLACAAAEQGIELITTLFFMPGDYDRPGGNSHLARIASAFEAQGGRAIFVRLTAPAQVLCDRVTNADRFAHGKITDTVRLARMLRSSSCTGTVNTEGLTVDTAANSPEQSAAQILAYLQTVPFPIGAVAAPSDPMVQV